MTPELADLIKSVNDDFERGDTEKPHLKALLKKFLDNQGFAIQMLDSSEKRDRGRVELLIQFLKSGKSGLSEKEVAGLLPVLTRSRIKTLEKVLPDEDCSPAAPINKSYWGAMGTLVSKARAKISKTTPRVEG